MYYHSKTSPLRFAPVYVQLACFSGLALLMSVLCGIGYIQCLPSKGEADILASLSASVAAIEIKLSGFAFVLAVLLGGAAVICYHRMSDTKRIKCIVRQGLFQPSRGNSLHLHDGDLLPRIWCRCIKAGIYELTISAQQSVTIDTILNAASSISSALNQRYEQYAITQTNADAAFNSVTFRIEDVKVDRSLTVQFVDELPPKESTLLRVDQLTYIDLTTSGSILVAGKTRSGKTTGVISLLLQVLAAGPDDYGSQVTIIDPKQAELSRLPYTVTVDADGEAKAILMALEAYCETIRKRQQILNDLSEKTGDAVKWWEAGFHPSFVFVDEYVACRTLFPKKAPKDSAYCLDIFDALVKRIVTMGASAGCYAIISIAEASVQEGGLPAMLRSAMGTKVLFRPTLPEARLLWDAEKLTEFSTGRVYSAGDAWFSSTDSEHDAVSFVHFPHMEFPAYKELRRLLAIYYDGGTAGAQP